MLRFINIPDGAVTNVRGRLTSNPIDTILELIKQRYPDAPDPNFRWCRVYYERCLAEGPDGTLVAVYFPPAFNYVLDCGFESLVIYKSWLSTNVTGDPTFPHWDEGSFYSTVKEDASNILYPFMPRDLMLGTAKEMSQGDVSQLLKPLGIDVVDSIGSTSFLARAPAYREEEHAIRARQLPEVTYVERNSVVRIIDVMPGWTLDRVF